MKIYRDSDGLDWVAVGVWSDDDSIFVTCMRDDSAAVLRKFTFKQWNDLPHHWFVDRGVAPKTDVLYKTNRK